MSNTNTREALAALPILQRHEIDAIFDAHQDAPTMSYRYYVTEAIQLALEKKRAALATQPAQPVATVAECEACFTPDVCQLRGTCDHYSAQKLRVATQPAQPSAQGEAVALTEPACRGNGGCCPDDKCEKWMPRASAPAAPAQAVPIAAACRAIIAGYEAGKSGFDDDMIEHMLSLGDHAAQILALAESI